MYVIYSPEHRRHNPEFEIYDGKKVSYAETPDRAQVIIESLRQNSIGTIIGPDNFEKRHISAIHSDGYINFLRRTSKGIAEGQTLFPSYFITDTYAPLTSGTYTSAVSAVNTALTGAKLVLGGQSVAYALCRPPGHHASIHSMGGYCYFNNTAIAANYLASHGRVAILDIDYHHGNGTQEVFYDTDEVLYVSIHARPQSSYPYISGYRNERGRGKGFGFNINYPLDNEIEFSQYIEVLESTINDVENFAPDFLIISAGFDTYINDPIGGLGLSLDNFCEIGQLLSNLNYPTLIIQEGGYDLDALGQISVNFLRSFNR